MYRINKSPKRITSPHDEIWETAETLHIDKINWSEFPHCPETQAKMLFSDYGIHVLMQTKESCLLARYKNQNDPVCTDSCMELFICPNQNDDRYINLEFNPFGTMYLAIRTSRYNPCHPDEDSKYFDVLSLVENDTWTLSFTVPFEFIDRNFGTHTSIMRGNMFKCSEDGTPEHYVSLFPIDTPSPDFQRAEFFGEFILCDNEDNSNPQDSSNKEKLHSGELYLPDGEDIMKEQRQCLEKLYDYNSTRPSEQDKRNKLLKEMFASIGENCYIEPPLHSNWGGHHVHFGNCVYANYNLTLVDDTHIYVGDHTMFGPNVTVATAGHPILPSLREKAYQYNSPVHIGRNCWLGAGVIIVPGVTIGDNVVIGAGSVVTKDLPNNVVAVGNPCRVLREVNENDKKFYFKNKEIPNDILD